MIFDPNAPVVVANALGTLLGQSMQNVWNDPNYRAQCSEAQRNVANDPEHIIRVALAQRCFNVFTDAQRAAFDLWRLECSIQDRFDRCCHGKRA